MSDSSTPSPTTRFFAKLDPYVTQDPLGFFCYAYLYGHPGYDRPALSTITSMIYVDAMIFMSYSGFFDYLVIRVVEPLAGSLGLLFAANFMLRARLAGLWDFLTDSETSWSLALAATLETCGSVYWHLLFKIARRFPFSLSMSMIVRIFASTLPGGEMFADGPPCRNCTWVEIGANTFRSTAIQLAGQYMPLILVSLAASLLLLVQVAVALFWQYQIWNKIEDWAIGLFEPVALIAIRASELFHRLVTPLATFVKSLVTALVQVSLTLIRMHVMAWLDENTANDFEERLRIGIALLSLRRMVSFSNNPQVRDDICWWPPTQVIAARNGVVLFNHIYYGACHVLDRLGRRRPSIGTGPYCPLAGKQIRLIKLFPAPLSGQKLACQLITRNLEDNPSYIAISYRWSDEWSNDQLKTEPFMTVNGYKLRVGVGTYEALTGVRSRWRARSIWIDAVCINQDNDHEKGQQVMMMADIYARASKVVVWLGKPANASLAVRMLRGLWVRMILLPPQIATDAYELRTMFRSWLALRELVRRSWFERCWITQEVAVAKSVEIRYGLETVSWDVLASFASQISIHPLKSHISTDASMTVKGIAQALHQFRIPWHIVGSLGMIASPPLLTAVLTLDQNLIERARDEPTLTKGSFGTRHIHLLQRLRLLYQSGRREPLDFYLRNLYCYMGRFQCSEPRDRIYSVLSMCAQAGYPSFTPDYQKPIPELYTEVARYFYSRGKPFLAESGIGYEYRSNNSTDCQCTPPDKFCSSCCQIRTPSWVPNWHAPRFQAPLERSDYEVDLLQLSRKLGAYDLEPGASRFWAAKETPFICRFEEDKKLLRIFGARRLDILRHCGTIYAPRYLRRMAGDVPNSEDGQTSGGGWSRYAYDENLPLNGPGCWYSLAKKYALEPYPGGAGNFISIVEALWRTVITDASATHIECGPSLAHGSGQSPGPHPGPIFIEYAENLNRIQGGESFVKVLDLDAGHEKIRRFQQFHALVTAACCGRRFGITSQGYMGLFPMNAKETDEVWIVNGIKTPFLFRPCGSKKDFKVLENVGECYVHGLMYGEAWSPINATESILLR